jgi:hypothetical protein
MSTKTLLVITPYRADSYSGAGLAASSDMVAYKKVFNRVIYLVLSPKKHTSAILADALYHLPFKSRAKWSYFLSSLWDSEPAVTKKFRNEQSLVLKMIEQIVQEEKIDKSNFYLIFEDTPVASLLTPIRNHYPSIRIAIRSQNVLGNCFTELASRKFSIKTMAWKYETKRIRNYEQKVLGSADVFWTISENDHREYRKLYGIESAGTFTAFFNIDRYQGLPDGDPNTITSIGTIDIRKRHGLKNFLKHVWPIIRKNNHKAKLLLAGKNTQAFHHPTDGVYGCGFIKDDRTVISQGQFFLNPQISGSGIQLKSVVALLAKRVLVSTPVGVQGVGGKPGKHYVTANMGSSMADAFENLFDDPIKCVEIANSGNSFARLEYSEKTFLKTATSFMANFRDL